MSAYERRMVRLPASRWEQLDQMVEDRMGTVTVDFFIDEALSADHHPGVTLKAVNE